MSRSLKSLLETARGATRRALLCLALCSCVPSFAQTSATDPRAPITYRAEAASGLDLGVRLVIGLAVVALVGGAALMLLKRYLPRFSGYRAGPAQRLRLLEMQRIAPRLSVYLVEVDGQTMVMAQSGENIACTWPPTQSSATGAPSSSASPWQPGPSV